MNFYTPLSTTEWAARELNSLAEIIDEHRRMVMSATTESQRLALTIKLEELEANANCLTKALANLLYNEAKIIPH